MFRNKNRLFAVLKWMLMFAAYGFLMYKAVTFEHWSDVRKTFSEINSSQLFILSLVFLLMPLNWTLEAWKWQKLCEKTEKISFKKSLKAVLAGITTGYVTPNRVGEFAGRTLYLSENNRWAGVMLSFVNSITQNIVMTFFGIIGAWLYFSKYNPIEDYSVYFIVIGFLILILALFYFTFPDLTKKILRSKISLKIKEVIQSLAGFSTRDLIRILGISTVRYAVFCFQFLLTLYFFEIQATFLQAVIAIPAMYLFITYTPSFSFSEPAVRGSVAVMIFGVFSANPVSIMLCGIIVWIINFVIPMLAGSVLILKKKK